ncbi:MAG: hypothetical protein IH830_06330 [Planctomycetes bacterium]|nr:hypothetical protein [Planctomycetota bacterium]
MREKAPEGKLLCYPMAGPIEAQFDTLVTILQAVSSDESASADLVGWMQRTYDLSESFSKKVYSVLLRGTGFVERDGKAFRLTKRGTEVARSHSAQKCYRVFSRTFFGVDVILSILAQIQPATWDALREGWGAHMRSRRKEARSWRPQHLSSQLRFRIDWLRSLGLVDFISGRFFLSQAGSRERRAELEARARTPAQKSKVSHNDLEHKLGIIGAFFQFEVRPRASVNDILPASSRLRENRQVDCLWVRFVHFGGKLQYPFEVQISGSMADAIERLEMVANVVQKAVVVTDPEQQERMLDRLRVKRSPLLDKLVFLTPDEVDKVVEAAAVMKSFTETVFSE